MFAVPSETPYDVRFRLLGIPVRVHPFFWLATAIFGGVGQPGFRPLDIVIWIGCVFVSILVHEYGHGLMDRVFGLRPFVVLYWLGGLCVADAERQRPWKRIAVLIAGPGAGFLLALLVFGGYVGLSLGGIKINAVGKEIIGDMLQINILWGLMNLLPIYPLDGGQITGILMEMMNRRNGRRWAYVISLLTAGVVAIVGYQLTQSWFLPLLFGSLALSSYQALQQMHDYAKYGNSFGDDDADWWKR
jgi:Zn-dependent protease